MDRQETRDRGYEAIKTASGSCFSGAEPRVAVTVLHQSVLGATGKHGCTMRCQLINLLFVILIIVHCDAHP